MAKYDDWYDYINPKRWVESSPTWNYNKTGRQIGNLWDDVTGKTAAEDAAKTQEEYGNKALALQEKMYDQSRADQMPWMQAGQRALGGLEQNIQGGVYDMAPEEYGDFQFNMDDFQKSPYYQFLQDEGARGIERSAAARGGLASGATLAGLQQRGQNIAAGEFGNQFNRAAGTYDRNYGNFLGSYGRRAGEKTNQYNRLSNMAGTGQTTASGLGGQSMQYGRDAAAGLQGIGNTKAAGRMAGYNSQMDFVNNALNLGGKVAGAYWGGK